MTVVAQGFLYRQVRHMVGAMLLHARGGLDLQEIKEALARGSAFVEEGKRRWQPAPAKGLHLMWCEYARREDGRPTVPLPHELD